MKRYNPKKIDVRMTTTVVAYTSFCVGHVTRLSSLRTSLRNRRARSRRPPAASFTVSSVVVLLTAIVIYFSWGPTPTRWPNSRGHSASSVDPRLRARTLAGQEGLEPPTPRFGDRG